jgi:hypothetical protein
VQPDEFTVLRTGRSGTVIAVGPVADAVLAATTGLDVTVLYAATVRPFDIATLRATLGTPDVVVVEPYLAGTTVPFVAEALSDIPHRTIGLGVCRAELRHYGTPAEHAAAHGLDAASLRARIDAAAAAAARPAYVCGCRRRLSSAAKLLIFSQPRRQQQGGAGLPVHPFDRPALEMTRARFFGKPRSGTFRERISSARAAVL